MLDHEDKAYLADQIVGIMDCLDGIDGLLARELEESPSRDKALLERVLARLDKALKMNEFYGLASVTKELKAARALIIERIRAECPESRQLST